MVTDSVNCIYPMHLSNTKQICYLFILKCLRLAFEVCKPNFSPSIIIYFFRQNGLTKLTTQVNFAPTMYSLQLHRNVSRNLYIYKHND